jgi:hypothetical protein
MQTFIFEINEWEPDYLLSVNHDRHRDGPYSEYVNIKMTAPCIFPEQLAGRVAQVHIMGQRKFLDPEIYRRDRDWKPLCVAGLHLPPSSGEFYLAVPLENMPFLLTAFTHGLFRFISLWGPPLKRSNSLCTTVNFMRTVDLSDY